ncbi:fatty acid desaturase family protein [Devosia rhizoryzae]|uniref:Fatty acid desaturase family protein n=1 Tax=Devosia rhizoryzae TaxID=2774137 RepID=A0ABX7C6J9_9HYPH|nr:fatty acid desaturase family protein [Devosia rhizoryzae]QQR39890.1 fatty acid desaturase family protein [Devosia rhizoryzae]
MAKSYVHPATLKSLSVLRPWRTALAIAFDWGLIAAAIAVSQWAQNPLVYAVAVAVIGGRMHGFAILLHEFAHHRFINGRKELSDWVCDLLLAWSILTTVASYRTNHLAHHRYTNTDQDPDWVFKLGNRKFTFPKHWQEGVLDLVGYVLVVSSIIDIFNIMGRLRLLDKSPLSYRLARLGFYVAMAAWFTVLGIWTDVLLYWFVPYLTAFFLFMHVRSVAEHFGNMDYSHELGGTRSVLPHLWERVFFAPHNVNHHLEHHLYPSVPFYNLPQLHAVLMENPDYALNAHNTRGYTTGLVRETLFGAEPGWQGQSKMPAE